MKSTPATPPPIEHAFHFCPRCGAKHDAPGTIPFRCHACDLTLYFGPVSAVGGLVLNQDNELLLVRRARNPGKGMWGLPGGFVDRDETAEGALRREVFEETGLEIRDPCMTISHPNLYKYGGVAVPVLDLFFTCYVVEAEALHLSDGELSGFVWTRPTHEHLENMAFHSNRLALEHWLAATGR